MIYYDYKSSLTASQSFDRLTAAFGDYAVSYATVKNWFAEFRRGRTSLEDEDRSGRPSEAVTEDNVELVRGMIQVDPRVTYAMIEKSLDIHPPQVHRILHEFLGVRKRTARWVPRQLTEEQKAARVEWCIFMKEKFRNGSARELDNVITGDETWVYQFEPEKKQQSQVWMFPGDQLPVKSRRTRSCGKQMVLTFFSSGGHVSTSVLEGQRTVNSQWYCNVGLRTLLENVREKWSRTRLRNMVLHHDNAPAHTSAQTTTFLATSSIPLLPQPPYSPDLAPADFFLFPKVKSAMRGNLFPTSNDAVQAYMDELEKLEPSDYRNCFSSWFRRMDKCIDANGEYFEKI